jgi:pilus assembly protein CpaB
MELKKLKGPILFLVLAGLLAAGVAYAAYSYLQSREQKIKEELTAKTTKKKVPMVKVVVAKADYPIGTVLNNSNFSLREIEADLVYPEAIQQNDSPKFEGLKLARPIQRGRPVLVTDLIEPEVKDVASTLPTGQRALTIDIDNLNSIAGTLRAGNTVDLFLVYKGIVPEGNKLPDAVFERIVVYTQDLQVIATGQEFRSVKASQDIPVDKMERAGQVRNDGKKEEFNTITVLVNPRQAAKLILGQKMGSFRAVLRPKGDKDNVEMPTLQGADFLGGLPVKKGAGDVVELIAGGRGGGANMVTYIDRSGQKYATASSGPRESKMDAAIKTMIDESLKGQKQQKLPTALPALSAEPK